MTIGPKRLEEITEKASIAFWKSVDENLPELKAEHLDHGTIIALQWQMQESIRRYLEKNLIAQEEEENGRIQANGNRTRNS